MNDTITENRKYFNALAMAFAAAFVLFFHAGCANPAVTNTSRNVVEQMLVSTAVERCFGQMDLREFRGSKVFVDYSNLAPQVDLPYAKGQFELHLARNGIIQTADEKDAQYTLRLISGTLATDAEQFLLGTPPLPIPLTNSSVNLAIPELAFFKRLIRSGFAKFSLTINLPQSQQTLRIYESIMARTEFINYTILFLPFTSRNLDMIEAEDTSTNFDLF